MKKKERKKEEREAMISQSENERRNDMSRERNENTYLNIQKVSINHLSSERKKKKRIRRKK